MTGMNTRTGRTGLRDWGMLAGEAAKALGVGIQTLHFYEQQGLIPPPPRSEGGYRIYTPEIVERVRFIRKAQALGFSLDEVKEIFGLVRRGSSPCGRVQTKLSEKLQEVDRRLEELRGFRAELASLVAQAAELSEHKAEAGVCSIVEEAPPLPASSLIKPSLSRKRRVSAQRLESPQKKR
jgi:MerR family transcriptional regulator, copper efflux regulator